MLTWRISVLALTLLSGAGVAASVKIIVFDFSGELRDGGLPPPWTFRRWSPFVGMGDFDASARVVDDDGRRVLYLRSANSGFIVGIERTLDVALSPIVTWRWKVEQLPSGGSFKQTGTNDQALQLLFAFAGGKVVGYIWDTTGVPGASGSGLSWQDDVRVIVLEAGASRLGQWVSEKRDLSADFRTLFSEAPPLLKGVAIQSNSNHTGSVGVGYVGQIMLSP